MHICYCGYTSGVSLANYRCELSKLLVFQLKYMCILCILLFSTDFLRLPVMYMYLYGSPIPTTFDNIIFDDHKYCVILLSEPSSSLPDTLVPIPLLVGSLLVRSPIRSRLPSVNLASWLSRILELTTRYGKRGWTVCMYVQMNFY